ncbi:MAG: HU family DNA-binding protein [Clostridia bacterium]|nr:HU family DNA-binding protein [Clostridia bacterium]MBR0471164.1 HU family DNA-binding protein [Methanosphaera sp.]
MRKLTRSELERLVALQSNKYKKDVSIILEAYYSVLKEAIMTGYEVGIPNIGTFSNTQVDAKPARQGINPFTKEKMMLPAQQAFNKPTFRFRPAIKAEMKEETLGRVF